MVDLYRNADPATLKLTERFTRLSPTRLDWKVTVDDPHVRFSVWDETGTALAAISLDEEEAQRLAQFLGRPRVESPPGLVRRLFAVR